MSKLTQDEMDKLMNEPLTKLTIGVVRENGKWFVYCLSDDGKDKDCHIFREMPLDTQEEATKVALQLKDNFDSYLADSKRELN